MRTRASIVMTRMEPAPRTSRSMGPNKARVIRSRPTTSRMRATAIRWRRSRLHPWDAARRMVDLSLTKNDQWDVFYIDWPSGAVTRIGGGIPQIKQTTYEQ